MTNYMIQVFHVTNTTDTEKYQACSFLLIPIIMFRKCRDMRSSIVGYVICCNVKPVVTGQTSQSVLKIRVAVNM